jgi:hypothetical protein
LRGPFQIVPPHEIPRAIAAVAAGDSQISLKKFPGHRLSLGAIGRRCHAARRETLGHLQVTARQIGGNHASAMPRDATCQTLPNAGNTLKRAAGGNPVAGANTHH